MLLPVWLATNNKWVTYRRTFRNPFARLLKNREFVDVIDLLQERQLSMSRESEGRMFVREMSDHKSAALRKECFNQDKGEKQIVQITDRTMRLFPQATRIRRA
jgi:hypothetical protein